MTPADTPSLPDCMHYYPGYLPPDLATTLYQTLETTLAWETHNITMRGKTHPMPRLMAWYGPVPYSFSGTTLEAEPMTDHLAVLANRLSGDLDVDYDSVLANLYRDGRDSVPDIADG